MRSGGCSTRPPGPFSADRESVVLEQLEHGAELLGGIDVGIPAASVLAALDERDAAPSEIVEPLAHAVDHEREVVEAVAMGVELILPRAGTIDRLDQLDVDLSHVEER